MAADPEFLAPTTLEEAIAALGQEGSTALAGGTSIGLLLSQDLIDVERLVWLGAIAALREVTTAPDRVRIGSTVTLREVARHPVVRGELPALAVAAGAVGNPRVRAVATVGGALAHADPRQDLPPALVVLDAAVVLSGPGGTRTVPVAELATGLMETVVAPDELITEVVVPRASDRRSVYLRFTPGSVADYPTVAAAAAATRRADGRVDTVRLALAGIGPTVVAVPEANSLSVAIHAGSADGLQSKIAAVAGAAADRGRPVSDRLGSAAYKRSMAAVWARRALTVCLVD